MKTAKKPLLNIRELDARLSDLALLTAFGQPPKGWINLLRKAMNMSLRQMGNRLSKTPQAVKEIEKRESDESITLKSLREAGNALNMKLVYAFVPKDGSLEETVEHHARALAIKIVERKSALMKLEGQEYSEALLKQAVNDMTLEIKRQLPGTIWD